MFIYNQTQHPLFIIIGEPKKYCWKEYCPKKAKNWISNKKSEPMNNQNWQFGPRGTANCTLLEPESLPHISTSFPHETPTSLRAQILKKFNIAWKFQSRLKISISLENFNPDLQNSPQIIVVWRVARLKFSISLENFKILIFFNLWALRDGDPKVRNNWDWPENSGNSGVLPEDPFHTN